MPIIEIASLNFRYRAASDDTLKNIDLTVAEGEHVVITGPNEAGKSTLCLTLNGLIPHLVKGAFQGSVRIKGMETREQTVKDLFPHVGIVFQDFESQLFSTEVELEVAFGPENLGLPIDEIRNRIHRALELTGLTSLKGRQPATLSGGQKQLLAIASTLSLQPSILCLDEPTTDLDPKNKRRIFDLTRHLLEESKQTLVVVEHDTEEILAADRAVLLREGRIVADGPPEEILRNARLLDECRIMPLQLTEAFAKLGAYKPPLTVDQAKQLWRRNSYGLSPTAAHLLKESDEKRMQCYGRPLIEVDDVSYSYEGGISALRGVSLRILDGEFIAILGQNGSGKTTLAKHLNGLLKPERGSVRIENTPTTQMSAAELGRHIGYVFQNPDHQIFEEQILDEVIFGPRKLGIDEIRAMEQARDALETVGLWERRLEDPFTLTKGLRQKVAVASVLATRPRAIVMDEPTTGLDYGELKQMMALIKRLNESGHTIIMITHCIWIAAEYAHRTILMSQGKIVADGPTREVFSHEELLEQADIIAPQIVRFSNTLGTTILSVEEFLRCVPPVINLDADPENANWLHRRRQETKDERNKTKGGD
ncbi:MAG: ATP-binding cassette domain-containing protein [Candidatus Abyssobacteria bacterium SURF_17]|uniref:ATP-binding cassette domain-containing protein n=1 Tax=Candidatus Abyssobacteria bacterium SURF_17 TaxID=2093361 RepID=A0A419ENE3_9BACT|nr:MAG: ATP-binding cassette domain-containing protein [Candidatus Abyssubacteria bacterium SURF_17]